MVGEAVGAAWSGVHRWFTPAVLFLLVNLVVGTIAVASRLMPSTGEDDGGERRSSLLLRAPSIAADRLRCFSFSRLGLAADHAPPVDEAASASAEPPLERPAVEGVERGPEHEPAVRVERSRSEAVEAPARWPRARRRVRSEVPALSHLAPADDGYGTATAREAIGGAGVGDHHVDGEADGEEAPAVEVDARADDFIRRFREQLRLQRLDHPPLQEHAAPHRHRLDSY